jgi:hypothetical protein
MEAQANESQQRGAHNGQPVGNRPTAAHEPLAKQARVRAITGSTSRQGTTFYKRLCRQIGGLIADIFSW